MAMPNGVENILALLVLLLQVGFTMIHIGSSKAKNTTSILVGNTSALAMCILLWWATGYAFSFGALSVSSSGQFADLSKNVSISSNFFLSYMKWLLIDGSSLHGVWFRTLTLAVLFTVIVCGALSEKAAFWVYPYVAMIYSGFVFPVAAHWSTSSDGWLLSSPSTVGPGYGDYGGAGWIHVVAGGASLVASLLLPNRYDSSQKEGENYQNSQRINSHIFVGGIISLVGLLARNVLVYTLFNFGQSGQVETVLVNSCLSCASSMLTVFLLKRTKCIGPPWNVSSLVNGGLAGLIAVCGRPGDYHPYGGFVIGVVAGLAYVLYDLFFHLCRSGFEDAARTTQVHLSAGVWGMLATPLFSRTYGVIYHPDTPSYRLFGWFLLGVMANMVWGGIIMVIILLPVLIVPYFKIKMEDKNIGLDILCHNEPAYITGPEKNRTNTKATVEMTTTRPVRAQHAQGNQEFVSSSQDIRDNRNSKMMNY